MTWPPPCSTSTSGCRSKPPRALNPAVPPALDALVVQMLAKKPEDRPQTAAEVRDRLADFETRVPIEPTAPLTAATAPLTAATEVLASAAAAAAAVPQVATVPQAANIPPEAVRATRPLPPTRKKSAGPWAVLAVIALLLLGAAVAYALSPGGSSTSSTSRSSASQPASSAARSSALAISHPASTLSTSAEQQREHPVVVELEQQLEQHHDDHHDDDHDHRAGAARRRPAGSSGPGRDPSRPGQEGQGAMTGPMAASSGSMARANRRARTAKHVII